MPYAVKEGGWLGLCILLSFAIITCYTGILLKRCLESSSDLRTYPDIGQAAFGFTGRLIISVSYMEMIYIYTSHISKLIYRVLDLFWELQILLYMELYVCCVEYIIMMSDNLSRVFPNITLNIVGVSLDSPQIFAISATLIVLPTVWLKDLSLLSYLSGSIFYHKILPI